MAYGSSLIRVMVDAARKASRSLARDFGEAEALQVSRKGPADYVSAADLKAERIVKETLAAGRPRYGFLLEEEGEIAGADNSNRWIVDPLDGTTNFLHGLPHYAISIGLERDRKPYAGVIYNPATDELFWAEKGEGAYLNNKRLRVSARSDISQALFATGIPFMGHGDHEEFLREIRAVMAAAAGIRRWGVASLDLAFVAAGRFDGFWERGLNPWDVAAGIIIAREAGAMVEEIDGGGDPQNAGSILASNGVVHDDFRQLLSRRR